ncbi:SDR family NAD(P)-dependent oxidoreductase [Pseudonocardia sp. TRM90224]|uniref:SDR family NAD(P)-dependent oxidoreductase n=1 Tax=Pseudonocardia sp. TRM90224 TaxID=2812678 RepID=UPI001E288E1D|nr:SDR family oxidoreductase [Pseudonocardia sp. TRM90224]
MPARFADRSVLVTGGGSGIGRAVALAFAREGAAVTVAGRTPSTLAETVGLIEAAGAKALAVTCDVTSSPEIARAVSEAAAQHGGLDIAVNAAGVVGAVGAVGDIDEDEWHRLIATNLTGTMLSLQHEIRHMREHGGGAIVTVLTTPGLYRRAPALAAYAATKAAVDTLSRAAARAHIGEGVRINTVSPGPTDTTMSYRAGETRADRDARLATTLPAGRVGTLDEIAAAVLYLASPESAFAVGTDLVVDGGAAA